MSKRDWSKLRYVNSFATADDVLEQEEMRLYYKSERLKELSKLKLLANPNSILSRFKAGRRVQRIARAKFLTDYHKPKAPYGSGKPYQPPVKVIPKKYASGFSRPGYTPWVERKKNRLSRVYDKNLFTVPRKKDVNKGFSRPGYTPWWTK